MYSRVLPVTGLWGVCSPGQCLLGSKWNLRDSLFCKLFINFPLWFPSSGLLPVAILCLPHVLKDPCLSSMHCSPLSTQNLQATSPPQGPSLPSPCPRAGSIPLSNESCGPGSFLHILRNWTLLRVSSYKGTSDLQVMSVATCVLGLCWEKVTKEADEHRPKEVLMLPDTLLIPVLLERAIKGRVQNLCHWTRSYHKKKKKKKKLYESGCCFPASPSPPLGGSRSSQNTQSFPSSWDVLTPETCIIWAFTKTPSLWDFSWMFYLNL